jgi:hypothetical protein
MVVHVIQSVIFHKSIVVRERAVATIDHFGNFAHCKCLTLWSEWQPPLILYSPCTPLLYKNVVQLRCDLPFVLHYPGLCFFTLLDVEEVLQVIKISRHGPLQMQMYTLFEEFGWMCSMTLLGNMSLCKVWQWWTLFIVLKSVQANLWRFFWNSSIRLANSIISW